MKIAIIGGSGFVGTKLIDILSISSDFEVSNIDIRQSAKYPELTKCINVLDIEGLTSAIEGIDIVVLLAAEHRDDVSPSSLYYDVNVQGMRNTLLAMEAVGAQHLIFTSSVAIYGLDKDNPNESAPALPFNHYGRSKWQAEQVLQEWYKTHTSWNIQILRPTVIFGEGNRGNVFNLLKQIATGKFLMIGNGDNEKSMSYVGNVVAFIGFLIKQPSGYQVYNYADKPDFTTNDLVYHTGAILNKRIPTIRIPYWIGMFGGYAFDLLALLLRRKFNISSVRVRKFCAVTKYDSSKAVRSGFVPPYTLEDGLQQMLKDEFIRQK